MGQCQLCKKEVDLPFTCSYCGQTFCSEHRLPEKHQCPALTSFKRSKRGDSAAVSLESHSSEPRPQSRKPPQAQPETPLFSRISIKLHNIRRKYLNRYQYGRASRRIKKSSAVVLEIILLVVLSLPLYLTYLIDVQVSRDPLTGLLLRNLVNENVFIPSGVYLVSVVYLLYKRLSHYRARFEWVLVFITSFIATWYITRFLNTMSALSMIFQSSQPELPGFLGFYELWIHQLTSNTIHVLRICQAKLSELINSGINFLREKYHQILS